MNWHYLSPANPHNWDGEPHPDVEVFYRTPEELMKFGWVSGDPARWGEGWYYWRCRPGCLPDSEPIGPFASEEEALKNARERYA